MHKKFDIRFSNRIGVRRNV